MVRQTVLLLAQMGGRLIGLTLLLKKHRYHSPLFPFRRDGRPSTAFSAHNFVCRFLRVSFFGRAECALEKCALSRLTPLPTFWPRPLADAPLDGVSAAERKTPVVVAAAGGEEEAAAARKRA